MLWAKRLRDENKILLSKISSKPDPSALEQLAEEVRSLASTIEHLQQDNQTLRQRMQELERSVSEREQAMCETIQGLGRSVAEMNKNKEWSEKTLVDVVKMIREEGGGGGGGLSWPSYQKYVRRHSSRPPPPRRGVTKITYRARTGERVVFFFFFLETRKLSTLSSSQSSLRGGSRMRYARHQLNPVLLKKNSLASSRALSQITTTDESIPGPGQLEIRKIPSPNQNRNPTSPWPHTKPNIPTEQDQTPYYHHHRPSPCRTTTSHQDARARDRYAALESIGVDPQGDKTLEEYFRDGASSVVRAMQLYEKRAAKAFVCGLRDKYRRMELWERLTERGWSWQQLRKEMQWMLEGERMGKGNGKGNGKGSGKGGRKISMEL